MSPAPEAAGGYVCRVASVGTVCPTYLPRALCSPRSLARVTGGGARCAKSSCRLHVEKPRQSRMTTGSNVGPGNRTVTGAPLGYLSTGKRLSPALTGRGDGVASGATKLVPTLLIVARRVRGIRKYPLTLSGPASDSPARLVFRPPISGQSLSKRDQRYCRTSPAGKCPTGTGSFGLSIFHCRIAW